MGAPAPLTAADTEELGKLRWQCRRGMQELDLLLSRYVNERFCGAAQQERDLFKELLETEDSVLYAYCFGPQPPPPRFAVLIGRITARSAGRG